MPHRQHPTITACARELRSQQTKAEALLWSVLRGRRLCGLKFRRQHAIGSFIADFACVEHHLVVEVDGGYHDYVFANDLARQQHIESLGWTVIRFANEDLLDDFESVAIAISRQLGLPFEYRRHAPSP